MNKSVKNDSKKYEQRNLTILKNRIWNWSVPESIDDGDKQ